MNRVFQANLAVLVIFLSACATTTRDAAITEEATPTQAYAEEVFPPVSLFYNRPSKAAQRECQHFAKQSILHHCREDVFDLTLWQSALAETGRFINVKFTDKDTPYTLAAHFSHFSHEGAKELGSAVLSGASLMLLPMVVEGSMKAEVTLAWQGQRLFTRDYILPFTQKVSLVSDLKSGSKNFADALTQSFLTDAAEQQLFSASRVAAALKATDYDHDFATPDYVAGYALADSYTYRSPFLGKLLRYQHEQFPQDFIDVFVYPIRDFELQNTAPLIAQEIRAAKREAEIFAQENKLAKPVFSPAKNIGNSGLHAKASIIDEAGQSGETHLIVYAKGDQFIKLRATFADTGNIPSPVPFASALISEIQPPPESEFMSSMRKRWRAAPQK